MTACHLVTHRELALGGDVNLHRFHNTGVDLFARFDLSHLIFILSTDIIEFSAESANDLIDLIADRRRIDLDPVIN